MLIWLANNGHLIALTCFSFCYEPGPYSWGAGPFTTELLLWYCAMLLWREMDSLQLLTLYLTPIFLGRKAKINLHTTPKLIVAMPISCLLRSLFSFQVCKMMRSPLACLLSCNFVVCFQSSPAIKSLLELTDCCLVYPTFFAIRLCFLQSLNKDSKISFLGGHFFSIPSHFDRGCFSSPM